MLRRVPLQQEVVYGEKKKILDMWAQPYGIRRCVWCLLSITYGYIRVSEKSWLKVL
jgi:hypothetical protein